MSYPRDDNFHNFRAFCDTLIAPWGYHLIKIDPAVEFPNSMCPETECHSRDRRAVRDAAERVRQEFHSRAVRTNECRTEIDVGVVLDMVRETAFSYRLTLDPECGLVYKTVWVDYFIDFYAPEVWCDGTKVTVSLVLNSRDAYNGRVTDMKLGRFIRMFLPRSIPDHVVETAVNRILTRYLPPQAKDFEFRVGEGREDFKHAYVAPPHQQSRGFDFGHDYARGCGHLDIHSMSSCMSPHGFRSESLRKLYESTGVVPSEAYASGDFKIVYLVHKPSGDVAARCVLRPLRNGKYERGYVYGTTHWHGAHLSHCLYVQEGVHLGDCSLGFTGGTLLSIPAGYGKVYAPYFDGSTAKLCTDCMEINGCSRGFGPDTCGVVSDCCQCYEEEPKPYFECQRCGNECDEDTVTRVDVRNSTEMWCRCCTSNHAFRCEDCARYFTDGTICGAAGDACVCDSCIGNYSCCHGCDKYFQTSEMFMASDDNCYCEHCTGYLEGTDIDFPVRLHNASSRTPKVVRSKTHLVYTSEPSRGNPGTQAYFLKKDLGKTYFYCPLERAYFLMGYEARRIDGQYFTVSYAVTLLDGRTVWRGHFRVVETPFGFVEFDSPEYHMTRLSIRPETPSTITLPLPGRFVQQELNFSPPAAFVDIDLIDLDFQIAHWEAEVTC